jgi:hypothetical protein
VPGMNMYDGPSGAPVLLPLPRRLGDAKGPGDDASAVGTLTVLLAASLPAALGSGGGGEGAPAGPWTEGGASDAGGWAAGPLSRAGSVLLEAMGVPPVQAAAGGQLPSSRLGSFAGAAGLHPAGRRGPPSRMLSLDRQHGYGGRHGYNGQTHSGPGGLLPQPSLRQRAAASSAAAAAAATSTAPGAPAPRLVRLSSSAASAGMPAAAAPRLVRLSSSADPEWNGGRPPRPPPRADVAPPGTRDARSPVLWGSALLSAACERLLGPPAVLWAYLAVWRAYLVSPVSQQVWCSWFSSPPPPKPEPH